MSWLDFAHFVYSVRSDSLWQKSSVLGSVKILIFWRCHCLTLKISLSGYRWVNTVLYWPDFTAGKESCISKMGCGKHYFANKTKSNWLIICFHGCISDGFDACLHLNEHVESEGTNKACAVLPLFHQVVLSHQPSLLLTANPSLTWNMLPSPVGCFGKRSHALTEVSGSCTDRGVRLSLLTNLTVIIIPGSGAERLKLQFSRSQRKIWIGCVEVLESV